jgi:hypothetical protein
MGKQDSSVRRGISAAAASLAAVAIAVTGCSSRADVAKDRAAAEQDVADSESSTGGAAATGSGGATPEASGGAAEESGGAPSGAGGYVGEAAGGVNGESAASTGGAASHVAPKPEDAGAPERPFTCPSTCDVLPLRSHGESLAEPFSIQPGYEIRTCLAFHVETGSQANLTALTFVLDNERVMHHAIVRRWSAPLTTGDTVTCPPEGAGLIIAQWEPGAGPTFMMPGGTPLGAGDFVLEMHYVNTNSLVERDRTGFDLCACPR